MAELHPEKRTGFRSGADIALSKHMLHLLGRPHLDFGQTLHSLQWGRKMMSAELLRLRCKLLQKGGARCACMQQLKQQKQKLPAAPRRRGGSPVTL
jgi:hypothetical protein